MQLVTGQRLGPYELLDKIGDGGMALVYRAADPRLQRHVAIKVLKPEMVDRSVFLRRFEQEAQLIACLDHPNILPIFDYGYAGDFPYIVMPLVTGGSMHRWIAPALPLDRALAVYRQVLQALGHAHGREPPVVHRDVKPANILMGENDRPLLTDFGIAKIVELSLSAGSPGTVCGTPGYMAPEQSEGRAVDQRADIYAMGVILYQLLTGRHPFRGRPSSDEAERSAAEALSPRRDKADLSAAWDEVIRHSMARNRDERYRSVSELDEAVEVAWRAEQCARGAEWQVAGATQPAATDVPQSREAAASGQPPVSASPGRNATESSGNLPRPRTSFIGREREAERMRQGLGVSRFLTVTGAGGCGKTRLALHVADALLTEYPDGVWLVELATVTDPVLVPQAVASAVGVREEPDRPILDTLKDYLRPRQILLILDNCEHLVGACALLVDDLLQSCPRLSVLATSQEALGVAGETLLRVPTLSLPAAAVVGYSAQGPSTIQQLMEAEATRLFVERARAVQPSFTLTERNARAVAQVCAHLDGIPLAIELAAARVKVLSVEQLAARLHDRFRLLTGGSRTALPRQQTLRATMDWSYDLLREPERVLFRRLSVFSGGCTLDAAGVVCTGDDLDPDELLDLLAGLVDKSLIIADTDGGEARYRLLETIRQYGAERLLEAAEAARLRARHAKTFAELVATAEPEILGPEQATWVNCLEQEHDNLRAALDWARSEPSGVAAGVGLAGALWRFWWIRGHLSEGRGWLEQLLAMGGDAPADARAKALNGAGNLAYAQGDYARARTMHEQCLALGRELGDARGVANSLNNLAVVAQALGDYPRAAEFHEQSLEQRRELGDKRGIAMSLNNLGAIAQRRGDYPRAAEFHEESLALRRELGDKRGIALSLNNLGTVALDQGDHAHAAMLLEESLALFRELGDRANIAASLDHLGGTARGTGDLVRAADLHEQALALRRELGDQRGIAISLGNLAAVAHERGHPEQAGALYVESLGLHCQVSDRIGIAGCLDGLARVASTDGHPERAAWLFGAAEALREDVGVPLAPADRVNYERSVAAAESAAGELVFRTVWDQGRTTPLDKTIAYASDTGSRP